MDASLVVQQTRASKRPKELYNQPEHKKKLIFKVRVKELRVEAMVATKKTLAQEFISSRVRTQKMAR